MTELEPGVTAGYPINMVDSDSADPPAKKGGPFFGFGRIFAKRAPRQKWKPRQS